MGKKGDQSTSGSSSSAEMLQDSLASIGDIHIRKMFGGHGIFEAGVMFALVDSSGGIFFKVDETNLSRYTETASKKHARMPYYRVPDEILGDESALHEWALASIEVSKGAK